MSGIPTPKKCQCCGKMFVPQTIRSRGCSGPCKRELERRDDKIRSAARKRWARARKEKVA